MEASTLYALVGQSKAGSPVILLQPTDLACSSWLSSAHLLCAPMQPGGKKDDCIISNIGSLLLYPIEPKADTLACRCERRYEARDG